MGSQSGPDTDPNLYPTPLEVDFYVALLMNPAVGSLLLGVPFGIAFYVLTATGVLASFGSPAISGLTGWLGGAFTMYLRLSRPY